MSTDSVAPIARPSPIETPLTLHELSAVLVKHYGLHEGSYGLWVEFMIGSGPVGPDKERLMPGAMIGVRRVGLIPTEKPESTSATVDAGVVNPKRKTRKKVK